MLIIGLGNPGKQYSKTKHNVGFWIVDKLADEMSMEFKLGKGDYMYSKKDNITFLKPLTFMNDSGLAVKEYINYFNINIDNMLVIYDDNDLSIGDYKFKKKGTSAGQKGVESIIYHLKTDNFSRLKFGIGKKNRNVPLKSYVLSPFSDDESVLVQETVNECCYAIKYFLENDIEKTMNKFNKKGKGS